MYSTLSAAVGAVAPTNAAELGIWNFVGAMLFFFAAFLKAKYSKTPRTGHDLRGYLVNHSFAGATFTAYICLCLSMVNEPLTKLFISNPLYLGLAGFAGVCNTIVTLIE